MTTPKGQSGVGRHAADRADIGQVGAVDGWHRARARLRGASGLMLVGALVIVLLLLCGCLLGLAPWLDSSGRHNAQPPSGTSAPATSEPATRPAESATPAPTTAAPATSAPIVMPSLVGKNAAVARDELKRLGFSRVHLGSKDPGATIVILAENWTVTEQSAAPGTATPADALIVLGCVKNA